MFHDRIHEFFFRKRHNAPARSAPRLRMGCYSVQDLSCHDLSEITHQSTPEM